MSLRNTGTLILRKDFKLADLPSYKISAKLAGIIYKLPRSKNSWCYPSSLHERAEHFHNSEVCICFRIHPSSLTRRCSASKYKSVKLWPFLDQKTLGLQLIRAVDSIAANIAEGFGRYHKKDKIKFFYNARASAFEVAHWVKTAKERDLFNEDEYLEIMNLLQRIPREINYLIKMTQNNLTK